MAFFEDLGAGRFRATSHTIGPWDAAFQHGGPPSALLGRCIERAAPREDMMTARVTVEILGPIPVAELSVTTAVVRPGKSVELVEATMSDGSRSVATARAWRVRRTAGLGVPVKARPAPPLPAESLSNEGWDAGYLASMEWRFGRGSFERRGPAAAWVRMRVPLVDGEETSPLSRVLISSDTGNGISRETSFKRSLFINPELTVHLHREAVGEWICVDAETEVSHGGVGLATTVLSDGQGSIGVGAQSLLVAAR